MKKENGEKKVKEIIVRNLLNTILFFLMNTEVLDQNGDVYFMLKNISFFVDTKCLSFLNKSFQEKKR